MAELKTKQNEMSVEDYINAISDKQRQTDCRIIIGLMKKITGDDPKMWATVLSGSGVLT